MGAPMSPMESSDQEQMDAYLASRPAQGSDEWYTYPMRDRLPNVTNEPDYRVVGAGQGYHGNGFELTGYIAEEYANLMVSAPKMRSAIQAALRIVDLWCPPASGDPEFLNEDQALHSMRQLFEELIASLEPVVAPPELPPDVPELEEIEQHQCVFGL